MDALLTAALNAIDCAQLTHHEWVTVGMALKDAGEDVSVWRDWSARDAERYHDGECERVWNSFRGSMRPVKAGTIVDLARKRFGFNPEREVRFFDWTDTVERDDPIEYKPMPLPKVTASGQEQLMTFIKTLYKSDEMIDIVTDETFQDKDGKWKPKAGHTVRVGDILRDLEHYKGEDAVANTIGDTNPNAGAWFRINPLDGNGHGNANVTAYRYTLVESDDMDKESQKAQLEAFQLPIATMTDSGGKSIHALVRIDAPDEAEYRKRVNYLYDFLREHGFSVDEQNKNPARLSRLPGVQRGAGYQRLLATDTGKATWDAWVKFAEGKETKLPDILPFGYYIEHPPVLKPELIHGVLRQGHKMMLQGPSKAGKSFALMEMCTALASGQEWLGWKCEKARSIYINMELDDQSCGDRLLRIARRMHVDPESIRNELYIWNLRGYTKTLDDLMADLIHMMRDIKPGMVVFDPIYKIMSGDENNASDMGHFVGQFDKISTELNTSIAIAHHYTKGNAGGKDAMDRSSGSGVFARDPDAIIDMAPLEMTESFLREMGDLKGRRPYRINTVLREFPSAKPLNIWFDYPVHTVDKDGDLSGLHIAGESVPYDEWNQERSKRFAEERQDKLWMAYSNTETHSVQEIADYLGIERSTVYSKVRATNGAYWIENGVLHTKE